MKQNDPIHPILPADYANASALAQAIAEQALSRMHLIALRPQRILDLGSATGQNASALQSLYPQATVIGVDLAPAMLQFAQKKLDKPYWACASAEALPLVDSSIDLIFANLLLPWCASLPTALTEWRRVLRPDGLLVFTTCGPDTLTNIQPGSLCPLQWVDMHDLGDLLIHQGFDAPVLDIDYFTLRYRNRAQLLQEAYLMGFTQDGTSTLLNEGPLQLKFEVILGHAWCPSHKATQPGTMAFPLTQLRQQLRGLKAPDDEPT